MSRKRATGLHERNTRFLLDTNVFIAASKRGWTRTTDLVLRLVDGEEDLIANEALVGEYKKYAEDLGDYGQLLLDRYSAKGSSFGNFRECYSPVLAVLS